MTFLKAVLNSFLIITLPLWYWAREYYYVYLDLKQMGLEGKVGQLITGKKYFWES